MLSYDLEKYFYVEEPKSLPGAKEYFDQCLIHELAKLWKCAAVSILIWKDGKDGNLWNLLDAHQVPLHLSKLSSILLVGVKLKVNILY